MQPEKLLEDKGLKIDSHVERKRDKVKGQIQKVSESHVHIKLASDGNVIIVTFDDLMQGLWSKYTPKTEDEEVTDWVQFSPNKSRDLSLLVARAKVLLEIEKQDKKHGKNLGDNLAIFSKPRCVKTKKEFKVGELTLVPSTLNINAVIKNDDTKTDKKEKKHPPNAVVMQGEDANLEGAGIVNTTILLTPSRTLPKKGDDKKDDKKDDKQTGDTKAGDKTDDKTDDKKNENKTGFLCPFWEVEHVKKQSDGNMKIEWQSTTVSGIKVPVMVNAVDLKSGAELKIWESLLPCKNNKRSTDDAKKDTEEKPPKKTRTAR